MTSAAAFPSFDVIIVGAGIVGLAHALAAAERGLSVAVIDRDAQANGASIRNFGFITVTGQRAGHTWNRAMRSRDMWNRVAPLAGIPILHRGLTLVAERPEAMTVLEEFQSGPMGSGCRLLTGAGVRDALPMAETAMGGLHSPHEVRIEPRVAIPAVAAWLETAHRVVFYRGLAVRAVETGRVDTTQGMFRAPSIVVCPGPDLVTLFPDLLAARRLRLCKLQMLRLAAPRWTLVSAVMGDLSLVRYEGYAALSSAAALKKRLDAESGDALLHGIHIILVQSADGSLVLGDSHHYAATPDPFVPAEVEAIIRRETSAFLPSTAELAVTERWIGLYPSSADETAFFEQPSPGVLLSMVSSGTGMSTAFALGQEGIATLLDGATS